MKLSVSLPEEAVALLDDHARRAGLASRSAALQEAIHLLRTADLEGDYETAWDEWEASGEREAWEAVDRDGLS